MRIRVLAGWVVGTLLVAGGCGPAEEERAGFDAITFALDSAAVRDAAVQELVARQRGLFAAMRGESAEPVSAFIEHGFAWNPTVPFVADVRADASYLQVLAGYRPPSLEAMPTAYRVFFGRESMAQVFAERADGAGGIIVLWNRRGGVWRASAAHETRSDLAGWESAMRGARVQADR